MTENRLEEMTGRAVQPSVAIAAAEPDLNLAVAIPASSVVGTPSGPAEQPSLPPEYLGSAGNDTLAGGSSHDVLYGNGGDDALSGGDGNDHIYGFGLSGDPSGDGNDTLEGGAGGDYIQGNAGDDFIRGGEGNDRLNGGAGADGITGDADNDSINGNKGNDFIYAGTGDDTARGGQGNDDVSGDEGNDLLYGDLGDDSIYGGAGHDTVAGGQGSDVFGFFSGHASYGGAAADAIDMITDFEDGTDRFGIGLGSGIGTLPGDVLHVAAGTSFGTVAGALEQAQQLLDGHAGTSDVAVLQVGMDSYLFYNDAGGSSVNSVVRVVGLTADRINGDDFTMLDRTSTGAVVSAAG